MRAIKIEKMKKQEEKARRKRRYYLHQRVRDFTTVNARKRLIEVNDRILSGLNETQRAYLKELNAMSYSLQYFIE